MAKKNDILKRMLVVDDASRYLDDLAPEQRRPQFVKNKLPESHRSFTKDERELAKQIYAPKTKRAPR
jgi:hypothetical protein